MPIPSCIAYFPEVANVGGCRAYPNCLDIKDQFWATLRIVEEEGKQCLDLVALQRMLEKRPITDSA